MLEFVRLDLIHPPLFYALLKIWIAAGGESLLWLRLFPVAFSTAAIAPFLLLCRELKLRKAEILIAFGLIAANGSLIKYAQEVRMYSVLFAFSLIALWLFARILNRQSNFVWLFVADLLLVYTHYFGWLFVAAQILAIVIYRRDKLRPMLILTAILSLCFAPWAIAVATTVTPNSLQQNIGWQNKPTLLNLTQFALSLTEPFYYQNSSVAAANFLLIAAPIGLIIVAAIIITKTNNNSSLIPHPSSLFAAAPIIIAFAASWLLPISIWGVRHLIIVFAPAAIAAAIMLNRMRFEALKIVALSLLGCLIGCGALVYFVKPPPTFIWCAWDDLATRAKLNEPLPVYVFEDDAAYHLWFALKDNPNFRVILINGYADLPKDPAFFLPRGFDEIAVADKTEIAGDKFYLAFRDVAAQPDKQVLRDLQNQNYKIGAPLTFQAQGVTAFLVPVEK